MVYSSQAMIISKNCLDQLFVVSIRRQIQTVEISMRFVAANKSKNPIAFSYSFNHSKLNIRYDLNITSVNWQWK